MTTGTWLALALAAVAVALLVVDQIRDHRRRPAATPLVAQTVLVQLLDGSAVSGVLVRQLAGYLVVENARLMENGADVEVDGAAWLPVERVRWIQVDRYQDGGER